MIRLFYSNHTEELLAAFADEVRRHHAGPRALDPVPLVVPNQHVEAYLRFGLARANGIAANLQVRRLERFVADLAAALPGIELLEGDALRGLLLAVLSDPERLAHPELEPVRHYLEGARADGGERGDDAADRRRYQLATRLSRLFEEYGLARPEMLRAWPERPTLGDTRFAATEVWERRLWLTLAEVRARRDAARGLRSVTLPELLELPEVPALVPPRSYVFGFSYMAVAFQRFFAALAARADVLLFTLNPCQEFWEDVDTDRRTTYKKRLSSRARGQTLSLFGEPAPAEHPDDPPALRLWGRPGRETIRVLNEISACDFEARFRDPCDGGEPTLLHRLQRDILWREPERKRPPRGAGAAPDGSLTILESPSIRREAEAIAQEIWRLVRDGDAEGRPVPFHDIAIIVNAVDRDAYLTHLTAAFAEANGIPHRVVDMPLARRTRVVEAIELLLALPLGTFTRADVLRVLTQPAIAGRYRDTDPAAWVALADALGIVHGADHTDHRDTYIAGDILNWDQGVRRVVLGAFMAGRRSGDERPFPFGAGAYLPEEVSPSGREGAARFGLLVRSLLADARFAKDARLTMKEWGDFFRLYATSYVAPATDEDEQGLARCVRALQDLERIDTDGRPVSFRIAYELAREALGALTADRAVDRVDGVVVSSFVPMRALPFKVVFVAGLGEGHFPAGDRPSPLDLRAARPRPGDLSPREQDRYMFLETLLSTRERLYLSYVSEDALTGEKLAPSSIVRELLEMLEQGYVGVEGARRLRRGAPLRRYDLTYFPTLQPGAAAPDAVGAPPEARREAQALALREGVEARGGPVASLDALRGAIVPDAWPAVAQHLGLPTLPAASADPEEPETVAISISALRKFLECPLQGYARFRLGLEEEDDEDRLAREDEPFETPRPDVAVLLRELFVEHVAAAGDEDAVYAARARLLQLEGRMPTGVFAEAERAAHVATLAKWRENLLKVTGGAPVPLTRHRFGRAEEHAKIDVLCDPILLELPRKADGKRTRVEIYGRTEPVSEGPKGSWLLALRPSSQKVMKEALKGFFDHVILAASGVAAEGAHTAFVNAATAEGKVTPVAFAPFTRDEALAYLATIAEDLLSGTHAYLLPCEAVFGFEKGEGKGGEAKSVQRIVFDLCNAYEVSGGRSAFSSVYGPVARPQRFSPPEEDEARAMIERRFRPFFARRIGGSK